MTILFTSTGLQGAMKDYYTRVREDLLPVITPTFAQFQKLKTGGARNFTYAGKKVIFDAVLGDAVGWNFSDAGFLGDSNERGEAQGSFGLKRLYVRQKFDRFMDTVMKGQGAFITLGAKIDEEFRIKMRLGIQEAVHGDGRGVIAVVTSWQSTTVARCISPYGLANGGPAALWALVGRRVVFRDSTGATRRVTAGTNNTTTIASVAQVTGDTYDITLADAVTAGGTNDVMVTGTAASSTDDGWNASPNGLLNITNVGGSNNTFAALSGASNATPGGGTNGSPRWNTRRLDASSNQTARPDQLTDSDLYDLCLRAATWSGVNPLTSPDEFVFITTPGLKKGYKESRIGFAQASMAETRKTNGGWGYDADYNGIPIIDDPSCPIGVVYLLHKTSAGWVDGEDWGVVAMDGMDEFRWVQDQDVFETARGTYFNLCSTRRNANAVISGYTEAARYNWLA